MKNNNISTSGQKIVSPERLEEKRKLKEIREANEKRSRAIEAMVNYANRLDW